MKYVLIGIVVFFLGCSNSDSKKSSEVELDVLQDTVKGVNLKMSTKNFTFTPENVNGANVSNEGHAHLYVDGVKYGRVYGEWFYVGDLDLGVHEFVMKLSNNDHSDMSEKGASIQSGKSFDVMDGTMMHTHAAGKKFHETVLNGTTVTGTSSTNTTLVLKAVPDAISGYNLEVETTGFKFTPENINTAVVAGEGHAHLFVDGVKRTRLYSSWYHLSGLPEGDHAVMVVLSHNDHSDMTLDDGTIISSTLTLTGSGTSSTSSNHNH